MTIAETHYDDENFVYDITDNYIGGFLGTTWCGIKYQDGSILVITVDPYDRFTGEACPVEAFDNFSTFEEWVKEQQFFKYHPDEYKALA